MFRPLPIILLAWRISPYVGGVRPSTQRAIVVLPEPASPTSDSVSPRLSVKLTPLTACTTFLVPGIGKDLIRSSTSRSALLMPRPLDSGTEPDVHWREVAAP